MTDPTTTEPALDLDAYDGDQITPEYHEQVCKNLARDVLKARTERDERDLTIAKLVMALNDVKLKLNESRSLLVTAEQERDDAIASASASHRALDELTALIPKGVAND